MKNNDYLRSFHSRNVCVHYKRVIDVFHHCKFIFKTKHKLYHTNYWYFEKYIENFCKKYFMRSVKVIVNLSNLILQII